MAFRWRTDVGLLLVVFGSPPPHQLKNVSQGWAPSDKTFWIRACGCYAKPTEYTRNMCYFHVTSRIY